ncbi:MAG: diphthine--ammonia ligase [Thermoplasmatota archaeon]
MRVVALLSGGKDSVAAIDVAQNHGWNVVVALTVTPAQDDAWLFHTPNLGVVRGVAECLGIPLVEAACRTGADREVEDLEMALRGVARAFAVDGIVSGAIESDYQRTRIEAIAHRLALKSFAPLWHKDAWAYLTPMLGWDIRFARVAADGVPNAWAGERLDARHLAALMGHPARPHPAGEGGEYETLVLAAPCYRRRLVVDRSHVEATAARATWVVDAWHTEAPPPSSL